MRFRAAPPLYRAEGEATSKLAPTRSWKPRAGGLGLVALALILAASPARAQEVGRCARVETPWPVTLPDGSLHEPGPLRLCLRLKTFGLYDLDGKIRETARRAWLEPNREQAEEPIVLLVARRPD